MSVRALSFEHKFTMRDQSYNKSRGDTYAQKLGKTFAVDMQVNTKRSQTDSDVVTEPSGTEEESEPPDVLAGIESQAIKTLREDQAMMSKLKSDSGIAWGICQSVSLKKPS